MRIFSLSCCPASSTRKHFLLFNSHCVTHREPRAVLRGRHNESVGKCAGRKSSRSFIDVPEKIAPSWHFMIKQNRKSRYLGSKENTASRNLTILNFFLYYIRKNSSLVKENNFFIKTVFSRIDRQIVGLNKIRPFSISSIKLLNWEHFENCDNAEKNCSRSKNSDGLPRTGKETRAISTIRMWFQTFAEVAHTFESLRRFRGRFEPAKSIPRSNTGAASGG